MNEKIRLRLMVAGSVLAGIFIYFLFIHNWIVSHVRKGCPECVPRYWHYYVVLGSCVAWIIWVVRKYEKREDGK